MARDTTIRDYLRVIFTRKKLFVVTIIPMLLINLFMVEFKTKTYTASVKMLIKVEILAPSEQYQKIFGTDMMFTRHADLATSKYVVERVVKALKLYELPAKREIEYASPLKRVWLKYIYNKLGLKSDLPPTLSKNQEEALINNSLSEWRDKISIRSSEVRSPVFMIEVTDYDASLASRVANAISRSYLIFDLEQQIAELELKYGDKHSTIVQMRQIIQNLTDTLDKEVIPGIETIPATFNILEAAQVSASPPESLVRVLLFALFAGFLLGITLIIVLDYFNQTIKSPKDVEDVLHADLLGSIPKIKSKNKFINSIDVNADYITAYKHLSDNIYMKLKHNQLKSVLITDSDDSKDTLNIIANIGIYWSHYEGHKVLIVDLNLRAPAISETFNISSNGNLIDVLEERIPLEDALKDLGSNLNILPASKPAMNPIDFFDSDNLKDLMNAIRGNYDLVLVYCADLKNFKDAIILSSYTDGTIIVMNEGKTHKGLTKHLLQPFEQKKTNIIGAILNDHTYAIPNIIYKLT